MAYNVAHISEIPMTRRQIWDNGLQKQLLFVPQHLRLVKNRTRDFMPRLPKSQKLLAHSRSFFYEKFYEAKSKTLILSFKALTHNTPDLTYF